MNKDMILSVLANYVAFNLKAALDNEKNKRVENRLYTIIEQENFMSNPMYVNLLSRQIAESIFMRKINSYTLVKSNAELLELISSDVTLETIAKGILGSHALAFQHLMDLRRSEIERTGRF